MHVQITLGKKDHLGGKTRASLPFFGILDHYLSVSILPAEHFQHWSVSRIINANIKNIPTGATKPITSLIP